MRKILLSLPVVALSAGLAWAGDHGCKGDCPSQIAGAEVAVENSADGVVIRITAKDAAVVKKIQDKAAGHFKKGGQCPYSKDGAKGHDCKECKEGKKCEQCAAGKKDHKCPECKEGKKCEKCMGKEGKHGAKAKYVCPMGCDKSDKPGKCSKCGMDLKEAGKK